MRDVHSRSFVPRRLAAGGSEKGAQQPPVRLEQLGDQIDDQAADPGAHVEVSLPAGVTERTLEFRSAAFWQECAQRVLAAEVATHRWRRSFA